CARDGNYGNTPYPHYFDYW
nr:immunoglobulin heavy chain junction region [Macaca mulatta]MOV89733.1 immunoglobulin heavy chain junction region [Macaca mulatta]MOV90085.1 immunoglobulin heavy chain junction region [Macaca mulatta]MOV90811.1 immunoglobulin heavy chain junction region [Macaca mulatta]MOV90974.1 immunoglobulin heavy chain junction region [Macaca mulatta]